MKTYLHRQCEHAWRKSPGRDAYYCTEPKCPIEVSAPDFLRLRDHEFASLAGVNEPRER